MLTSTKPDHLSAIIGHIPALTLMQPWASLVAFGWKRVETRSWSTSYRGLLAIHASKRWTAEERALCRDEPFATALEVNRIDHADDLPRGAVIAIARLVDVQRTEQLDHARITEEATFGNFTPGRYGWVLDDVQSLPEPIPAKGALGLWQWTPPQEVSSA